MIASETEINPTMARQILENAKLKGVTVEVYLKEISEKPRSNSDFPKVRKTETRIDYSQEDEWLKKNRQAYIGKWVVLDGQRLVGYGEKPTDIVSQARKEGVKIPFVVFINDDSKPFWGGWL